MVEHSIPALLVFITIDMDVLFLLKTFRSCALAILISDRHIDLLLSTEVAFQQSNIGQQNLFWNNYKHF